MKRTREFLGQMQVLESISLACLALIGFTIIGCAKSGGAEGSLFQLPWPVSGGGYSLEKISVESFDRPNALQGRNIRIYVDPYVTEGRLESATPIGRYVQSREGVQIPGDFVSLQAAAIHAHFERLRAMTESAGVKLNWPMRIGIQANVVDRAGVVNNNAIFDSQLDALLIVPYLEAKLPIAINGGILAHEHFHTIFQTLVLGKFESAPSAASAVVHEKRIHIGHFCSLTGGQGSISSTEEDPFGADAAEIVAPEKPDDKPNEKPNEKQDNANRETPLQAVDPEAVKTFNSFFLRAMNEGLADFWAWVYTGDAKFIEHSLPTETRRRMDLNARQLRGLSELKMMTTRLSGEPLDDEQLVGNAYVVGTDYARFMVELAKQVSGDDGASFESRMEGAKLLIKALPALAEAAAKAKTAREYLSPNALLKGLSLNLPAAKSAAQACRIIERVAAFEIRSPLAGVKCADKESVLPSASAKVRGR